MTATPTAQATYAVCRTPCKCGKRLAKASTFYAQKFETSVRNLVKMQRDFTRLLIAATTTDVATSQAALPTLAAAGKVIQECQEAVTSQLTEITTGLPALANTSAKLAALARHGRTTTTVKLTAKGGNGQFQTDSFADPPVGIKSDDSCGDEQEDDSSRFDSNQDGEKNAILEPSEYHRATITCISSGSTNCNSAAQTANSGYIQFALTSTTHEDNSKPPTRWGTSKGNKDVAVQGKVNITQGTKEAAQAALKTLKSAAENKACERKLDDYTKVSTSPLFKRQAIRSLLNQPNNEQDSTNPPDKLTAPITAAYGEGGKEYKTKLWEAIETLKPAITKNKERAELDVKENTPLGQLTEALARRIGEANSKASQTTKINKKCKRPKQVRCSKQKRRKERRRQQKQTAS
uniref:Variant surface glycoprotein 1420 n=1 Tax=Trypanosoma brucei TaxID=5691 RepID=M4SYG3_9TRYP|nr:variant surface glycoprotein 1420 [Trypanosoma brucei]